MVTRRPTGDSGPSGRGHARGGEKIRGPSRAALLSALAELREKEAMLVAAQRLTKLGSWVVDVATLTIKWSEEAHRIFGLGQHELATLTVPEHLERVHPHDRERMAQLFYEARARRFSARFEYRFLRPDGAVRLLRGEGESQLDDSGRVVRLVGTMVDVTEQELVQRDSARLRLVQEQVLVWLWEQDEQLRFTTISEGCRPIIDVPLLGKTRWGRQRTPLVGTWDDHRAVLQARQPFTNFEYRIGSGETARVISTTGAPVFDADGRFRGYRGTSIDVTEERNAQGRAEQTQSLLEIAARLGRVGAWVLELPQHTLTWSSESSRIHQLTEDPQPSWNDIVDLVHEPWRSKLVEAIRTCRTKGRPLDVEVKSSAPNGRVLWFRVVAERVCDSAGEVRRIQGAVQDITADKEAAEDLARVNAQLTATLESITDAFVTLDPELRVTYVNPEAERLTGVRRKHLLGRRVSELLPRFPGSVFEQQMIEAAKSGVTARLDGLSRTLDKWLHIAIYPSSAGLALYIRDVTESRAAKQALLASEERYRLLFEESGDALLEAHADGSIRRANPAACALFGRSEAELQRLTCHQLVLPGDGRLARISEARERSGRARSDLTMLRADGSLFEAEVSAASYRTQEGELLTSLLIRDVSQRIEYERGIMALNDELARRVKERTAQLEAVNDELRSFAQALAHDLRSPIAAMLGFGHALHQGLAAGGTEQQRHQSERLVAAARRLGDHMDGLLAMYRISQAPLSPAQVDLSELANAIIEDLRQRDPDRVVRVHVQPGLQARADSRLVRIALENLLGNAWKFTSARDEAAISFTGARDGAGQLVYCVRDNGAGFDMTWSGKLFESFQRLHTESEFPGTGLGLATVKRVIARHGGTVSAESALGVGASFMFTLPSPPGDGQLGQAKGSAGEPGTRQSDGA